MDHPYSGIVLLGDFNQLKDANILSFPLKQVVRCPTRGRTLLDKIYTNIAEWYNNPTVLPPIGKSDHNVVLMESRNTKVTLDQSKHEYSHLIVRSRDQNSKISLAHALRNYNWNNLYTMNSCEEMLNYFYTTTHRLLETFLPTRTVKVNRNEKPWVTENFRYLIRRRQYAWTNQRWEEYRIYRNKVQRAALCLRKQYYKRRVQDLRQCNPRKWWQEVKRFTGQSTRPSLSSMATNSYHGDLSLMANDINCFLQSVSADLKPLDVDLIPEIDAVCPTEFIIEPYEVEAKLSRIDTHKSNGPDELPNWFLKEFSVFLAEPVCSVFNASVREGIVPSIWKLANVVPIPKVNTPKEISKDIRPISLTPTLSKVIESFVGQWVLQHIESKLDVRQYGCLKGKSTTHELVDLLHHWHQALDKNQSIRAVFIDYAKAFDHVDHSIVIRKLIKLGVPNILVRWICSFLQDRHQRIKLSNTFSDWLTLKGAMPQGSWLGPLTFIVLMDDLSTGCLMHKYVDDTTLSEIIGKDRVSQMEHFFGEVLDWSALNLMNINTSKTKEMIIGNTITTSPPLQLFCGNESIERVISFKLLGILIDNNLKWDSHINSICSKASSRLHFLVQLKRNGASVDDMVHFYQTVIRPVLEYACPAWHTSLTAEQHNKLESIQKRALKIIYGQSSHYDEICQTYAHEKLIDRRVVLCKTFFNSITNINSCLNYLLPQTRSSDAVQRLRKPNYLVADIPRTTRFQKSFLIHALNNYQ